MKYYINDDGKYLGATDGDPLSQNEVSYAPEDARQKWNGVGFDAILTSALDAEKDTQALALAKPKKAFTAIIEQLWDNSAELQAAFPNPNGKTKMKQDAIARYRAKL